LSVPALPPELAIVDVTTHQIVKRMPQASPFCPNIAVTPENDEVWITLKDVGKVQVFSAKAPFEPRALLETAAGLLHGPRTERSERAV
jgi:hypothetical protein